ncbi:MAG TPA: hypothetical protein PKM88_02950, partial [bacterium]|nr:hypothetical protein [bacterium]
VEVLHPDTPAARDINTNSVVLRLTYGGRQVLLAGDATKRSEQSMLTALPAGALRADVLKIAHHGSRGSNTAPFLAAVAPQAYVIMCSANNSYGHPHAQAMERIAAQGGAVLRTDRDGSVTLLLWPERGTLTGALSGRTLTLTPPSAAAHSDRTAGLAGD